MISVSGNYSDTTLVSKIGRNIKILADTFANDCYYLSESENFPRMPPETINDTLYGNWLTDRLGLSIGYLNK